MHIGGMLGLFNIIKEDLKRLKQKNKKKIEWSLACEGLDTSSTGESWSTNLHFLALKKILRLWENTDSMQVAKPWIILSHPAESPQTTISGSSGWEWIRTGTADKSNPFWTSKIIGIVMPKELELENGRMVCAKQGFGKGLYRTAK